MLKSPDLEHAKNAGKSNVKFIICNIRIKNVSTSAPRHPFVLYKNIYHRNLSSHRIAKLKAATPSLV